MKVFEKRGYAKTYDETGKLLTKVLATEEVVEEEDLFEDE
jgi:hypothetical protein